MARTPKVNPGRLATLFAGRRPVLIALVVVFAAAGIAIGLSVGGSRPAALPASTTTTTTTASAPTGPLCPLTNAPAPLGSVPKRPALLVKIGNEPGGARPQSGLNEADIVFDTPAEGFIMRYVAVYQCDDAAAIGPTRSVRWVDWNMIARMFVHPILAFAGGIDPNVNGVGATPWISGANLLEGGQAAGTRISTRVPPDNLYTSTSRLYALFPRLHYTPHSIFAFGARPAAMTPAKRVEIDFSGGTDAIWQWLPAEHSYLHTWSGVTDIDTLTNKPVTTTNIVILVVHYGIGPYSESRGGSGDIESTLTGTGTGYVVRGGSVIKVTWSREQMLSGFTFTGPSGQPVTLASGRTFVEIATDSQAPGIKITP